MYFDDTSLQVGTKISEEHPAYKYLVNIDNRSEFLRTVLKDLVTVNGNLDGYMKIREAERIRKYYGVPAPAWEQNKKLLNEVKESMADDSMRRKKALEVVYTSLWERYRCVYFKKEECSLSLTRFFISYRTDKIIRGENADTDLEIAFMRDLGKLNNFYAVVKEKGMAEECKETINSVGEADGLFISLAMDWCIVNQQEVYRDDGKTFDVADYILTFMETFFENGLFGYEDIHAAFLRKLRDEKMGCFHH